MHVTSNNCLLCPRPRGIKRWCCLTSVCLTSVAYIRSAGSVCGRPAGWRVLADRARLGRPGSGLSLRTSVAGLGGAYCGGRPPTACLLKFKSNSNIQLNNNTRLTAIFQDNLGKLVPGCHHSGFYCSKDGSSKWSCKTCKVPVKSSPPTHQ